VAGSNLTLAEATARAALLAVESYDIQLDLTDGAGAPGAETFRSRSEIRFTCTEPGTSTFIDLLAAGIRGAVLNGVSLDISGYEPQSGLALTDLAGENLLVIEADCQYTNTGEGLHRFVDPVDGEVYLYSQFESADAQRVFACFDQPDLKASFTFHITAPSHWQVISNAPVKGTEPAAGGAVTLHYAPTPRMSTYITAVVAGPYHAVRDEHDGIPLGVYCRSSLAQYLDADEILTVTKQGFDFFHERFGVRYAFGKYDQIFCPEYNAGAMENAGCITLTEDYIFRGKVTAFAYENRANTILHEMAHMWFGDLVTMRWWDDLWLNESFAEWAAHWAAAEGTQYTESWTAFCSGRKAWGYRQDQLSSTHPISCDIPDVQAVEVNFDGITYAKGASVLKQLVAYVGEDAFLSGLRIYFKTHAHGNTTLPDLLHALEEASGRDLGAWARQWLETTNVNTFRPQFTLGEDSTYTEFSIGQEAPAGHPTLRSHRVAIGLYDLAPDGRLVRRDRVELDVEGAQTSVPALVGQAQPDLLLLNDDDLTYTKIRLDERSLATLRDHIAGLPDSLARGLCWAAAWDMTRDAEMPTREYLHLALNGLPHEPNISVVQTQLRQVFAALDSYADPTWAPQGYQRLAETALAELRKAEPGSDHQLVWARTFASAARSSEHVTLVTELLAGSETVPGLVIDPELRWHLLHCAVAMGALEETAIAAEFTRDHTDQGEKEATTARALIPTAEAKREAWRSAIEDAALPNQTRLAILRGFAHPAQKALLAPFASEYFEVIEEVWRQHSSEVAQNVVILLYPSWTPSDELVQRSNDFVATRDLPPALERLVNEGRDGVLRALKAQSSDGAA
jgi:aminopeptidase N